MGVYKNCGPWVPNNLCTPLGWGPNMCFLYNTAVYIDCFERHIFACVLVGSMQNVSWEKKNVQTPSPIFHLQNMIKENMQGYFLCSLKCNKATNWPLGENFTIYYFCIGFSSFLSQLHKYLWISASQIYVKYSCLHSQKLRIAMMELLHCTIYPMADIPKGNY